MKTLPARKFKGHYLNRITIIDSALVNMSDKDDTGFEEEGVLFTIDDPQAKRKNPVEVFLSQDAIEHATALWAKRPQEVKPEPKIKKMYGISFPSGLADRIEYVWKQEGIDYTCYGSGCGTAEYKFPSRSALKKALCAARKDLMHQVSPNASYTMEE
jgi:hypothetical protein